MAQWPLTISYDLLVVQFSGIVDGSIVMDVKKYVYLSCLVNCGQSYPTISLEIRRQTQQHHITELHDSMMDDTDNGL